MKKQNLKTLLMPVIAFLLVTAVWCSADYLKKSYHVIPKILSNRLPFKESQVKLGGYEAANIYLANSIYPLIDNYPMHKMLVILECQSLRHLYLCGRQITGVFPEIG